MAAGKEVGRLSIKVTPDLDGFYRQLKEAVEAAEKMKVKIPVEPDMGNFRAEVAAKTKGMTAKVKVDADVDGSFIDRTINRLSKIEGPSFGSGINPAGYAAIFAGITVLAAPLLGLITTALLSLPGLIALVATPIAALALGLDGLKEAAESIKEPFDKLREAMSAKVKDQFTPIFKQLPQLFPMLERSLPSVTQGLADMAQGAIDAVARNSPKVEATIRRIGDALTQAKPGVDGFVSGFIGLADELSKKFPGITDWFNKAGENFDNWVSKITEDGSLSQAFSGLGDTLKTVLDLVVDLGKQGLEWIKKPENIEDFVSGLKSIADSLRDIAKLSADLKDVFANMLPDFSWEGFKEDLSKPFTSDNAPWRKFFEPSGPELTDAQKALNKTLEGVDAGQQARSGNAIDGINQSLQEIPQNAAAAKVPLDDILAATDAGQQARNGNPVAPPPPAPPVQPPNLEPAKAAVTEYQVFIDDVTAQVRGALSQATSGESLPAPNFEAFKAAWNEIPTFVTTKGNEIEQAGKRSADGVANSFQGLSAQVAPHFEAMRVAAVTAFDGISASAGELPGKIEGALGSLAGIGNSAGLSLMSGLTAGMQAGEGAMLAYVGTIADKIAANKGPLPYDRKVLVPAGEALMEGLGTGLESGLDPVLSDVRSIAGQIFQAFKDTFGTAPQALALNLGGLQNSLTGVQTTMQSTLDTTNDLSTSLTSATSELATGSSLMADDAKRQVKDIQDQMDLLELQKKQLKVQKNEAGSKDEKAAIQDKIDALQAEKDKLAYQKDQLKIQQKQTGELGEQKTLAQFLGEQIASTWEQGTGAVAGFARANLDQAMGDLGIGGGALTNGLNAALDWGTQALGNVMNIQVNSVDDAIAVKNNEVNKQALTYTRR
uniref:Tape measure protein n=1 Tax=Mycobacterium phage QTRlifeCrisis TaxID=3136627 RepID=A0AAU8GQ41_9VIRU